MAQILFDTLLKVCIHVSFLLLKVCNNLFFSLSLQSAFPSETPTSQNMPNETPASPKEAPG